MNEIKKTDNQQKPLTIAEFLKAKERQIAAALPKHMTSDKLLRVAMTEITRNPLLKQCTMESLIGAILNSAAIGLFPDSLLGEAYLIPYKNNNKGGIYECQFMVGYKGMIKLMYNSGLITVIDAHEVYENDEFDFEFGSNYHLRHKPTLKNRGNVICYYSMYKIKGNDQAIFNVLSHEEIERHKSFSKTANSKYSAWVTHYDEMAKKTCIRALAKYAPKSAEDNNLAKAVTHDEKADLGIQNNASIFEGETTEIINGQNEITQQPTTSKAAQLASNISAPQKNKKIELDLVQKYEDQIMKCTTKSQLENAASDMNFDKDSGLINETEFKHLKIIYENKEKNLFQ